MVEISAAIDIEAPPETVWAVLTDVEAYPQWNTLLRVNGSLTDDDQVDARVAVPGLPAISIRPRVVTVVPEREIRWRSTLFGFTAAHSFVLEPTDEGAGTRFVQYEEITGPFADRFIGRFDRRFRRGFEQMNIGLRRRVLELTDSRRVGQPDHTPDTADLPEIDDDVA